jgi:hypothetical protein
MGRLSGAERARDETAIRAAMDRFLSGDIPPGGKCDLKTLVAPGRCHPHRLLPQERPTRPLQYLAEEFERRLTALRQAQQIPDPREAKLSRLKSEIHRPQGTARQAVLRFPRSTAS